MKKEFRVKNKLVRFNGLKPFKQENDVFMNNENDNESAYKNAFLSSLAYGACALYNRTVIYLGTARLTLTGCTSLIFQI